MNTIEKVFEIYEGRVCFTINKIEGIDKLILSGDSGEKMIFEYVDSIIDIFKYVSLEDLKEIGIDREVFIQLIDDNIIIKAKEGEKIDKIFFYDMLHPMMKEVLTKHIKSNNVGLNEWLGELDTSNYFNTLWGITFDFVNDEFILDGNSSYYSDFPKMNLRNIYSIFDIDNLREAASKINDCSIKDIKKIYLNCSSYVEANKWAEETCLFSFINDRSVYTYNLFDNKYWDGDFKKFIVDETPKEEA